eukprot:6715154-Prymnesium_polylepis.1
MPVLAVVLVCFSICTRLRRHVRVRGRLIAHFHERRCHVTRSPAFLMRHAFCATWTPSQARVVYSA